MADDGEAAPPGAAGLFDRVADTYDQVGVPWFGPIAEGLVEQLAPRSGEHALDVGCGRGAVLLPLARAVGADGSAVGIDLAPRMVAAAAQAARAEQLHHVDVRVGDASAPEVPARSFDLVASSLVLFFLPDPLAAVRAWVQLLRPGGRLGVSTFGPNDPLWDRVDAVFAPYLPPGLRDARTSGTRGPFGSDEGMEQLLAAAGLRAVRTVGTTCPVVLAGADHWYEFSWSHGQRAMWEAVPPERREEVRAAAYAVLEEGRRADGSIRFEQHVRYTLGSAPP
ncbi:ubiquinone/menaquinone biosynthesis C-methylase UbiE [Motilibacter peucedani]|uniref:Ubiquinone/menaquinone biosynthesis C-methylase UbiE n=1 Tax=Motilibacter peucedani TaxID=598650 RepID=A0A420XNS6_9ACTN|nr:methyltransferase domain-containing protein [Motilibacter peucedani]RKS73851.1 ubiquinone/menaquinone biosynthesis C-methylase UbiE [Motilibacter peucedani]